MYLGFIASEKGMMHYLGAMSLISVSKIVFASQRKV